MPTALAEVQELLVRHRDQIAAALPKHVTPERMTRLVLTAMTAVPNLSQCSALSIAAAAMQSSFLGLETNTPLGEAFLIPYWNSQSKSYVATFQVGYLGLVKLAMNSGLIDLCDAQPVYEADEFDFEKGSNPYIRHKPPKRGDRGEIIGYYGMYLPYRGRPGFEYMTVEQINAHRDKYSQGAFKRSKGQFVLDKDGNRILQGPWKDSPDWMYRKTPLKQALKLAPKSQELRQLAAACQVDTMHEAGITGPQSYMDIPMELLPPADPAETVETESESVPAADALREELIGRAKARGEQAPALDFK